MITIYKETRYAWNCPTCGYWNYMYGDPKHKDKIICKHCSELFTEFEGEVTWKKKSIL